MLNHKLNFIWHVKRSQTIRCSSSKLWRIISSESNLELFHPFVKENQIISWKENQYEDILIYLNGRKMKRQFVFWKKDCGYDLYINQAGFKPSFVSWRIKGDKEQSMITISIWPYLFNKGSKAFNWLPFQYFVRPSLDKYLYSVLKGLKHYLENDVIIKKNQFGKHPWFSA